MSLLEVLLLNPNGEASSSVLCGENVLFDPLAMSIALKDSLTTDPSIKGQDKVSMNSAKVWNQVIIFQTRVVVLYFTRNLPSIGEVAGFTDHGFRIIVVDKIFYSGSGLFEVLFFKTEDQKSFLSSSIVILYGQVVHVLQWQPIRTIKEELLSKCPICG
ncbi:hypothetical protein GOP47_0011134 [Adiantum capillus-veneris]|uniref:Uncharacterized protein n=1 Tax=Adiantum capillus-veneris TaxID=13818 RepID=A0A9D4ZHJ8_ADICA|nr:hypothetical protein GOP47_0011134 [Adiantum capillus-veneris]